MRDLNGKVAVVTGASSGIGRATALELARQGCDVAMCCKSDVDSLNEAAAEVRQLGRRALAAQVDVADREAVFAFAGRVISELGDVHILVNNAGVGLVAPVDKMEWEDFEWIMQINFWGVVYCTRAFLPQLKKHPSHIVNVSSVWGLMGSPGQAAYTSSKFAVRGYTEALSMELADTSVTVSVVHPGGVKTDIARKARFGASFGAMKNHEVSVELLDRFSITSAERAAKILVKAIRRRRRRVLLGPDAVVLDALLRLFPSRYQRIFGSVIRRL